MPNLWQDAMASLSGDAGAQARVGSLVKSATGTYDWARGLIGSSVQVAAPSPEAAQAVASASLSPGGFTLTQIGVGALAFAAVLWLALRRGR